MPLLRTRRRFLTVAVGLAAAMAITGIGDAQARTVKSLIELRRKNVVMQEYDLSCGAAALAILLRYQHGDFVGEREIAIGLMARQEYVDNPRLVQIREGFSLLDLKRYVETRGYKGLGFGRMSVPNLLERAPVMVPINTHGYNHFVVFRGMLNDRVLLADPSWGNRTMTVSRFKRVWIDYPAIGQVGFVVQSPYDNGDANVLAPDPRDFLVLR